MTKVDRCSPGEGADTSPLDAQLCVLYDTFTQQRPRGADEDVHMVASVVDHVIERLTAVGDLVLDPFAGFGTTAQRAVALGRGAVAIELLPERVAHIHEHVPTACVIEGDARGLLSLMRSRASGSGAILVSDEFVDLVLTSPPYMTANQHEADALTAYERDGGDYDRYLAELGLVAAQCARVVKPGGYVVWNVADIHYQDHTTHLIADCSEVLQRHLTLTGRTEIVWDCYPHDLVSDALLVFRRDSLRI